MRGSTESSAQIALRDAGDFVDTGDAIEDSHVAALAEGDHPFFQCDVADLRGAGSFDAELADGVARVEQLVDTDSARVPGLSAIAAADGLEELFRQRTREVFGDIFVGRAEGDFALGTQAADEALRDNTFNGARTEIRLDPHVNETCKGTRGIVRMQSAEDQVPGERGLNGALRSFVVTNFTDEDDVRVVTQNASQTGGESQTDL